jgi:hypothetical protein
MDRPKSQPPVTRGALERVLARAAELQAAAGDESEPIEALSEQQIIELGNEVGLSPEHIRQALAEERVRIEPLVIQGTGLGHRLFGANSIAAQRVVRGAPERLLEALDRWMQRAELLEAVRQRSDRTVWEPKRGVFAALGRAFGGKENALGRANEVSATAVPVDKEFTLVRLEASFAVLRRTAGSQVAAGTLFGAGASGVLAVLGVMLPVAVIPAVVLSGGAYYGSRRTHRHALERGLLALEQALDRLERGEGQQHPLLKMIESALPPSR